jgi:hypothetical protein
LYRATKALFKSLPLLHPATIKGETRPAIVLYKPAFALHNLMYLIMRRRLDQVSPAERSGFSPFLRGARFALLANLLINNEHSPILAKYGIKLEAHERKRVEYVASLPELIVTPPEDGNRKAERGQKGGRMLRFAEGLLAPPPRVSWASRERGKKRRAERKARALASRR